ncbi:N-formylglutamate amidohydrolase [Nannocystaceae bacterium ST9]
MTTLLESDEPAAVETLRPEGRSPIMLVCDHASNRVPRRLGTLGLGPDDLASHIAWDPGAAIVARRLSELLDAPLVLAGYSRLVIDCNRPLISPQSIAEQSAGVVVPGNRGLSADDRASRVDALFHPYQDTIAALLAARGPRTTTLLAIHSFTPVLAGQARPWPIAVAHGRDRQLADSLIAGLRRTGDFLIGDNEPYSIGREYDYTIPIHGEDRGLPCAMIEIRQDGLTTTTNAMIWADRLAAALVHTQKPSPA